MLATADPDIAGQMSREIDKFLQIAARRCPVDLYRDRRAIPRYHRSMPLPVALLDQDPVEDVSVTLRDVSADGIGFYCDTGFPSGCLLGVKLFWSDPRGCRVPAVVRHTLITQQGFLVGAQFVTRDPDACERVAFEALNWYG